MSEQEQVTEQPDGAQLAEVLPAAAEAETKETNERPAGYEPVDVSNLPPEVKDRIDYLYSQVKGNNRTLLDYRRIAEQQSKTIDDLVNGVGSVVNHLQERDFATTEAQIAKERDDAWERGDIKAYHAADEKLTDIKVEKKLSQKKPAQVKQPEPEQELSDEGYMAPEDKVIVDSWQDERGDDGRLLRPWAFAGDPKNPAAEYKVANAYTMAVLANPKFQNATLSEKLAEVDRLMGTQKSPPRQNVMGGGLTGNRKTNKITLSSKQEQIAVRTKFGGSKAKSDAEHIEAYRKQVERVQQAKGARK